jgi:Tol biopolymer transport system component
MRGLRTAGLTFAAVAVVTLSVSVGPMPARATFPGTNGRLLVTQKVRGVLQLFSMDADGSHRRQLTHLKEDADYASSPEDGGKIAFDTQVGIWVMDPDGTHQAQLTSSRRDFLPAFSPDGARIAFTRFQHGSFTLEIMHVDGSHQRILAARAFDSFGPDWSPDGTRVAFTGVTHGGGYAIYQVTVRTRVVRRVPIAFSPDSIESAEVPSWSPDGSKLAFSAQPVADSVPTCHSKVTARECLDVFVIGVGGGVPVRVTEDDQEDIGATWSPDGSRVVFSHDGTAGGCSPYPVFDDVCSFNVFTMAPDGSDRERVTRGHHNAFGDWWLPG